MMPLAGKVIPLEELPDETFASAILGGGCGIEPTGDTVYAPFDGTVTQVPESLHAVGLMSDDGIELLIHVGMDTVEMKGNGFTSDEGRLQGQGGHPAAQGRPRRHPRRRSSHGNGHHRDQRRRPVRNVGRGLRRHRHRCAAAQVQGISVPTRKSFFRVFLRSAP